MAVCDRQAEVLDCGAEVSRAGSAGQPATFRCSLVSVGGAAKLLPVALGTVQHPHALREPEHEDRACTASGGSRLGYSAAVNPGLVIPPLLLLSGVGEVARNGIVLNPFLGMRFKVAVVATDMPLQADRPVDFGLQDFCKKCKKCAVECPSQAISHDDDKSVYNGYEKYPFSAERCARFRLTNPHGSFCGRCIKVCPWNKPKGWTHDVVRWMIQHTPFLNNAIIRADDLLGYGRAHPDEQWWLDVQA